MIRSARTVFVATLVAASLAGIHPSAAQADDLVWTTSEDRASKTAQLNRHVPETDNVQVTATCGANAPDNATSFMISVATGNLKNGEQTRLRFFGGGNEYEFEARTLVPSQEEGFQGVEVILPHTDPVWDAFEANDALRYQIPGYESQTLPLGNGHSTIKNYVSTCKTLTADVSPAGATADKESGAKDAFNAARELNTAAGFEAFIKAYPSGFYADLARAHLKKMQGGTSKPATAPTTTIQAQPLSTYAVGPAYTPWYSTNYNGNPNAAAVSAGGLELIAYCTTGGQLGLSVRDLATGQYPQFRERVQQAVQREPTAELNFSGEGSFRAQFQSSSGDELSMSYPVASTNGIVRALMSGKTLYLNQPPFGAIFQLKNSRTAICAALNSCGAYTPECGSSRAVTTSTPATKTKRCRDRSVYVEGRGCVLKKNVKSSGSSGKCRSGQIRVEGKCMSRREAVGFCGPGYRVSGGKCVSQAQAAPSKPTGKMLKRNEGGTISEAACRKKGMIPEMGYCVEND